MIRTTQQAIAVQARRAKSGKRGYAKAVRRYFARTAAGVYRAQMNSLSVNWKKPSNQQVAA